MGFRFIAKTLAVLALIFLPRCLHCQVQPSTPAAIAVYPPPIVMEVSLADQYLPAAPEPVQTSETKTQSDQSPLKEKTVQSKNKKESYSPTATTGSPGHIFWVIPAFRVTYGQGFKPLTSREKFSEWSQSAYDPLGLTVGLFESATLEYSAQDGFCGYGHGWGGYGKCFGAHELDANVSSFIGDYALAVAFHQDPRYFRLGHGSLPKRVFFAVSRVFVTYNDSGKTVFYSSALSGTAIASGVSNLYYPSKDRGFDHSMTRIALDLGNTAIYNAAAEFWPDIQSGLHRIF